MAVDEERILFWIWFAFGKTNPIEKNETGMLMKFLIHKMVTEVDHNQPHQSWGLPQHLIYVPSLIQQMTSQFLAQSQNESQQHFRNVRP